MSTVYGSRPVKRQRRTQAELSNIHAALYTYAEEHRPVTVRQLFYAMSVQGIVPKEETGYKVVQRELLKLRRSGALPYHWISDNTRWMTKPRSFSSLKEAAIHTVRTYRRAVWLDAPAYIEVWCEKDALAGVIAEETGPYDVPLMVARGFSSETFLYSTGERAAQEGRPCHFYYFGDHDPSGVVIPRKIEEGIRRHAPHAEIHFQRVGITEEQVSAWNLPTRPTKQSDSRSKSFRGESCELDALPPAQLRALVRACIESHINPRTLEEIKRQEQEEKETWLAAWGLLDEGGAA